MPLPPALAARLKKRGIIQKYPSQAGISVITAFTPQVLMDKTHNVSNNVGSVGDITELP